MCGCSGGRLHTVLRCSGRESTDSEPDCGAADSSGSDLDEAVAEDLDGDEPVAGAHPHARWSRHTRAVMAAFLMNQMTAAERLQLKNSSGKDWPKGNRQRWKPIYDKLLDLVRETENGRHEMKETNAKIHELDRDTVKEAAKTWTLRLLRTGSVVDAPPHVKGYKHAKNHPHLQNILELIMAGYPDAAGNKCLYRNLHDLRARRPEAFAAEFDKLSCKTMRGLWLQLQEHEPKLMVVKIRMKKVRNDENVRVCPILSGMCT